MMTTPQTPEPAVDLSTLSPFARWSRALKALATVLADPDRTDEVLVFSTYANAGASHDRAARFFDSEDGRRLYAEHRAIDSAHVDLDALAALPADTLGYAYAQFLRSRGFTPDTFQPPEEIRDPRTQYVVQRLRQTHDLWHVVTGHATTPAGEIALQAFTFAQTTAPSAGILAAVGTLHHTRTHHQLPREVMAAFRRGRAANKLATFPWEDHWATPLADVRAMLGVECLAA